MSNQDQTPPVEPVATPEQISAAKFRVLQAESRLEGAKRSVVDAEIDLKVARSHLDSLVNPRR